MRQSSQGGKETEGLEWAREFWRAAEVPRQSWRYNTIPVTALDCSASDILSGGPYAPFVDSRNTVSAGSPRQAA